MFGDFYFMQNYGTLFTTTCGNRGTFPIPRKFLVGWFNFFFEIMGSPFALLRNFPIGELGNTNHQTFLTSKKQKWSNFAQIFWNGLKPPIYSCFFWNCTLNFVYNIEWRTQTKANGEHTPQKCKFGSDNFLKGCFNTPLDHTPRFLPKDWFFS